MIGSENSNPNKKKSFGDKAKTDEPSKERNGRDEKNVQPEIGKSDSELEKYVSPSTIDYVLEVNAGFSDKNNIRSGQMISGLEQL